MIKTRFLMLAFIVTSCFSLTSLATPVQPVVSKQGMVVSEQQLASQVGVDILRAGGNAIDAAVAVGYALAVVNPCCGNIGGGGFMTVHLANGKNLFINFRERAPLAAKTDMFLDATGKVIPNKSTFSFSAVGVPGTVLGLDTALTKYGTMKRQQVMAPAIKLAQQGYVLTPGDVKILSPFTNDFKKSPNIAAIFLKNGQAYKAGERLVQKDLGATLALISADGPEVFYHGKIATAIVQDSTAHGGLLTLKDFADYSMEMLAPVTCHYHGYTVVSAPPPSSGGTTLCEILNILEKYPLASMGFHSTQSTHYIVEAMRYAFFDRNNLLGDPDFVNNPVQHLLSKDYAAAVRAEIQVSRASSSDQLQALPAQEGVHTTHYSVVDKSGNAVSVTYTLNNFFGAQIIAGTTGFFLNDEMDDFSSAPGTPNMFGLIEGENNKIEPGKRPLSSMTPTIVLKGDKVTLVVGSPGGPRIITATLEAILNVLDYGMNVQQAVDAPRFHHQWMPDVVYMEPQTFSLPVMQALTSMGYHFVPQDTWSAVEAIYIDPISQKIYGGSDKRRSAGAAIGY